MDSGDNPFVQRIERVSLSASSSDPLGEGCGALETDFEALEQEKQEGFKCDVLVHENEQTYCAA